MKLAAGLRTWLIARPIRADAAAILLLTLLWAFYFWRVLTPAPVNQVSLPEGDFSGQFLAFGAYQARRLLAGEIPLWNPYNNAGHPFLADTQSAVFYPPRLITIVASKVLSNGWGYGALQAEAIAHYWLAALWMYCLVRAVTRSRLSGIVSAIAIAYGGYLSGYPPLQLAVLEAGIWLPLALLGVYKSSEARLESGQYWHPGWLAVSALALGLSLLAGHPQTSLFSTYVIGAYVAYRGFTQAIPWRRTAIALSAAVGLGFGMAAVQLLPGLEYTRLTTRAGYGFDQMAGGFPFSSLITIFIPNVLTNWSPLYFGIPSLALAVIAFIRREKSAWFWAAVAVMALGVSFGGRALIYRLAYLAAPGFAMFRGQERAAFVMAYCVAILAGLGAKSAQHTSASSGLRRALAAATAMAWFFTAEVFLAERLSPQSNLFNLLEGTVFLALMVTLTWAAIGGTGRPALRPWLPAALVALIVLDLFSVTMNTNWEPIPATERTLLSDIGTPVLGDKTLFRIDAEYGFGRLGPGENYGTLVGVQDIRGTSPLKLDTLDAYLQLPKYRLRQLLSVKYVFISWEQLEVPSQVIAREPTANPPIFLHEITEPIPRAWMVYRVMTTPDRGQALGWLADASFDPSSTVILEREPTLDLPQLPPDDSRVSVEEYLPERISLDVSTPADGVLVVSEWYYPGWQAILDGEPAEIWEANAGLRALPLTAGEHHIEMVYRPTLFLAGAAISVASMMVLATITVLGIRQNRVNDIRRTEISGR